ncbi:MAG: HAD family hydrolase, partial [Chloroflexota bacterium]|nr:HAD family hydrolase [Chloroflexota bacterium]
VLYAVDELSGFVMAVALVRPSRSIHDVDVRAVNKKLKDKAFARAVHREEIYRGAEELGVPLDEHVQTVIDSLRRSAKELELEGEVAR